MTTVTASAKTWAWSPEVLELARREGVEQYLDPLLEAVQRLFPTVHEIRVYRELDPEIEGDEHITFEAHVSVADAPDHGAATKAWVAEVFRLVPKPQAVVFRESLLRVK